MNLRKNERKKNWLVKKIFVIKKKLIANTV